MSGGKLWKETESKDDSNRMVPNKHNWTDLITIDDATSYYEIDSDDEDCKQKYLEDKVSLSDEGLDLNESNLLDDDMESLMGCSIL